MRKRQTDSPHKTIIPYIIAIVILLVIAVVAMVQMQRINSGLDAMVMELNAEQQSTSQLVNHAALTQVHSHQYIITGDDEDANAFYDALGNLQRRLEVAQQQSNNATRQLELANLNTLLATYESTFRQLVSLMYERTVIETETINVKAQSARELLILVKQDVMDREEIELIYAFDATQATLEIYQYRVAAYLREPNDSRLASVEQAYDLAQEDINALYEVLPDGDSVSNASQASVLIQEQQSGLMDYHERQRGLDSTIDTLINDLEPSLVGKSYDLVDQIKAELYREYNQSLTLLSRTRIIMLITLSVSIIASIIIIGTNIQRNREQNAARLAMAASEARYQDLFQNLPVCVYRTATSGEILDVNPACITMMNAPDLASFRSHLVSRYYVDPADRIKWQQLVDSSPHAVVMDTQLRCYDDTVIWAHITGQAHRNEQGEITHYEGSIDDITARIQAQEDLKVAQQQLVRQEKLAILGQLAGGVGHDLRNPLGIISNAVYYLKHVLNADRETQEYLDIIMGEVYNADHIVSDLLNFARTKDPEREPVTATMLLQTALERVSLETGITRVFELGDDLPEVYVDPRQINQVLVNLISNACQAMEAEGGTLTLRTARCATYEDCVTIDIQDSGPGISEEHLKRLFEPLFTTKRKGIGLGLVTSRNLAEANSAHIDVQSKVGVGSVFSVHLPTRDKIIRELDARDKESR